MQKQILLLCLKFNNKFYLQNDDDDDDLPMGTSLFPILADN